ncbi:MAG TPA: SDR family oxidoreductase [Myxococcales bacterium]|jgi:3-oxoacyl-[acyl-carrier protein] reductase|nr:SDR family oxidoreductase [Myxococcales bacterium]
MQPVYPDLKGRAAIVTGASSGIGLGIARALLAQGMRVAVHYRSGREPAEALGAEHPGRAFAVGADLGTERGCGNLAREAVERLGGVDVLVHSAGIWNPGPIEQMEAERLEEMFRVNVFSAFYLVRELAAPLRASGHGSIVLVGSTAGQRGEQGHSHYAASKGALQSLAMSLAVELAPRIRTNVVSPGWIRTPMAEVALRTIGPLVASTMPNRRLGEIEDVVNAVLYLSSDASSHLLGENISVSGGALLVVPRGQIQPR